MGVEGKTVRVLHGGLNFSSGQWGTIDGTDLRIFILLEGGGNDEGRAVKKNGSVGVVPVERDRDGHRRDTRALQWKGKAQQDLWVCTE